MHLVQLLLPIYDRNGQPAGGHDFAAVRRELTEHFGGVTVYTRAPAVGTWKRAGDVEHDDSIMIEVVVDVLDRDWWAKYRAQLEHNFGQEMILARAIEIVKL